MKVYWEDYNGKKILVSDYRGTKTTEETLKILKDSYDIIIENQTPVYRISNYIGAHGSQEFMDEAKKYAKKYKHLNHKHALLGIDGLKRVLYNGFIIATGMRDKVRAFSNEDEAKKWLAKD